MMGTNFIAQLPQARRLLRGLINGHILWPSEEEIMKPIRDLYDVPADYPKEQLLEALDAFHAQLMKEIES